MMTPLPSVPASCTSLCRAFVRIAAKLAAAISLTFDITLITNDLNSALVRWHDGR
jgi:hypothetical protein